MFVVDYTNGMIANIYACSREDAPDLPANTKRVTVESEADLEGMNGDLLLRLHNYLLNVPATVLPPEPARVVWAALNSAPAEESSSETEEDSNQELQTSAETSTSEPTQTADDGAGGSSGAEEATTMAKEKAKAKSKKATTKAAAPAGEQSEASKRKAAGLPREGSKKDKLLKAAMKDGGVSKAEGQKITGWQEFRGTLGQMAAAIGKQVHTHQDPEGKKATRWEVK